MAFETTMLRRVLPLAVIVFNFILAIIAIVDLARGFAFDSYVAASFLLCITSFLTTISLSLITFLNFQQPDWMPYAFLFELGWAGVLCLFQFISAVVMSSESVTDICHSGEVFTVRGHNLCPTHSATLVFAWTSWLLLVAELLLVLYTIFTTSRSSNLSFRTVLFTPTSDLTESNIPLHLHHNVAFDMEKSLPRAPSQSSSFSGSSTGSGRRKHRPPPLDLTKVSVTNLPIYHSHAKKEKAERRPQQQQQQQRRRPSRHQIMREVAATSSDHPYAGSGLQRTPSNASSVRSNWTAPKEWEISDPPAASQGPTGIRGLLAGAGKSLPTLPGAAMTTSGARSKTGGVVDRPDPRDRRPAKLGELESEGGFWVSRHVERI